MPSARATTLRIAMALAVIEQKPTTSTVSAEYLFDLRQQVLSRYGGETQESLLSRKRTLASKQQIEQEAGTSVGTAVSDLRRAAKLLSNEVESSLETVLEILVPKVETLSFPRQSHLDLLISSLYSIQLSPQRVVDLQSRLSTFAEAIVFGLQQETAQADLEPENLHLESAISSIETLLPFLLGWTCRLSTTSTVSSGVTGTVGSSREDQRFDSFAQLLVKLVRAALDFPSSSTSHSIRLTTLVFDALSILPQFHHVITTALLDDLSVAVEAFLLADSPSLPHSVSLGKFDTLTNYLHIFLSHYPRCSSAPSSISATHRLPQAPNDAVRRLESKLATNGIEERLGERVENACLAILELCWLKFDPGSCIRGIKLRLPTIDPNDSSLSREEGQRLTRELAEAWIQALGFAQLATKEIWEKVHPSSGALDTLARHPAILEIVAAIPSIQTWQEWQARGELSGGPPVGAQVQTTAASATRWTKKGKAVAGPSRSGREPSESYRQILPAPRSTPMQRQPPSGNAYAFEMPLP
ncbi:hypothetical protein JCM3765_006064 [Sporobolomyces pararoseus]